MQLTREEQIIHEAALKAGLNFVKAEWPMILSLQEVERAKLFKKFDKKGVKAYAIKFFGLSDSVAEMYVAVARKAEKIPVLGVALASRKITAGKANRILSAIDLENADELIDFASKNSDRKVDLEVGRRNPKKPPKDGVRVLSGTHVYIMTAMTIEDYEKLKRVESLEAQKQKRPNLGELVGLCAETHLEKHDPVRKAKRAKPRKAQTLRKQGRKPTAETTDAVNRRDEGKCTFVDEHGVRCNCDRWVALHHLVEYAKGGSNEADNLTTLCWFHHDLVHQYGLPLDGQISWLRDRVAPYECESRH